MIQVSIELFLDFVRDTFDERSDKKEWICRFESEFFRFQFRFLRIDFFPEKARRILVLEGREKTIGTMCGRDAERGSVPGSGYTRSVTSSFRPFMGRTYLDVQMGDISLVEVGESFH